LRKTIFRPYYHNQYVTNLPYREYFQTNRLLQLQCTVPATENNTLTN